MHTQCSRARLSLALSWTNDDDVPSGGLCIRHQVNETARAKIRFAKILRKPTDTESRQRCLASLQQTGHDELRIDGYGGDFVFSTKFPRVSITIAVFQDAVV